MNSNTAYSQEETPTHFRASYAIIFFIKITRIGFAGNQFKIFMSRDSTSLITKKSSIGIQPMYVFLDMYEIFYNMC